MNTNENTKKYKIKIYLIILILSLITCGIFLRFHLVSDTYWNMGEGYENYKYYLSESLWSDHIAETAKDLSEDGKYDWEHYYLTGADYAR